MAWEARIRDSTYTRFPVGAVADFLGMVQYKKPAIAVSSPGPSIPIDQLINIPMSATPKPPVERYFHLPAISPLTTPTTSTAWRASDSTPTNAKRPRAHDETGTGDREAKKVNVASGSGQAPGYVEVEWVGPYGV
jgi:hypothetical protein